jgi:hypothetical protein
MLPDALLLKRARRLATRTRSERACRNCRQKKLKCSGFLPCGRCIAHPEQIVCEYESSYKQESDMSTGSKDRPMHRTSLDSTSRSMIYSPYRDSSMPDMCQRMQSTESFTDTQVNDDVSDQKQIILISYEYAQDAQDLKWTEKLPVNTRNLLIFGHDISRAF